MKLGPEEGLKKQTPKKCFKCFEQETSRGRIKTLTGANSAGAPHIGHITRECKSASKVFDLHGEQGSHDDGRAKMSRHAIMQVTQLNMNHCETAQQLLWQSVSESTKGIALLSGP